jgi:hypothetical protein
MVEGVRNAGRRSICESTQVCIFEWYTDPLTIVLRSLVVYHYVFVIRIDFRGRTESVGRVWCAHAHSP